VAADKKLKIILYFSVDIFKNIYYIVCVAKNENKIHEEVY